ncbi:hypothetical protein CoNPh11_CDS0152 [Staphylococcus phage S-CoN_Ph11]|nr:hypothetical protein CoNPh11_CDS0152 [Staphylococcus phage S-CoN_Ph11]
MILYYLTLMILLLIIKRLMRDLNFLILMN